MGPPRLSLLHLAALLLASTSFDFCFGKKAADIFSSSLRPVTRKDLRSINNSKPQFSYKNNTELEYYMKGLAKSCESIMRLYSIGTSVLGFPLWVLEISDKPGYIEAEPAFKYVGNLHGDEPVGRELLLLLGNWLCDNYMKDPLATLIVRDVHLHLLPSMNPDGFKMRSRNNANNVDLNRDFPDQFFPRNNNENFRQLETRAIMNWTREHKFVASASLHGGALVANYPWDGTPDGRTQYSQCDDDKTFRYLAKIYSGSHVNMYQSTEFSEGVTNGASWYPLYGGMQDWNYIHGKCMDLTLEITENKWPSENELKEIWEANRLSMLLLVASLVKCGVHGRVISSSKDLPLPASISVKGINFTVYATEEYGAYHRLLSPGKGYEVTASMHGYISQTAVVLIQEGQMTRLDFKLQYKTDKGVHNESSFSGLKFGLRFNSESFIFKQLRAVHEGDVTEIVTAHLRAASTCLTIGVLILFIFFLYRYRAFFKVQKSSRQSLVLQQGID